MTIIDLRSDTLTKPSLTMLETMCKAEVGDDVYSEDYTVNMLQNQVADMFGKSAALFMPSGTMANQIAIALNTKAGDEIIADYDSHIYNYENSGIAFHSRVQVKGIKSNNGEFSLEEAEDVINPKIYYMPNTSIIALENTHNRLGGRVLSLQYMQSAHEFATRHNLVLHLDGARIWNALATDKYTTKQVGEIFDTISVCFSKGLGAPIGSMLLFDKSRLFEVMRLRKLFGGGMRQVGVLAAAAHYALHNNLERIKIDNQLAKEFALEVCKNEKISLILNSVESNIVIFSLKEAFYAKTFVSRLKEHGLLISQMGNNKFRIVTYNAIDSEMLIKAVKIINKVLV